MDFQPTQPPTTGLLRDRMQNLSLNGDSKLFHYCYVCNTQLNSCKQALLHCSGKRHRKKLLFLQSRKSGIGQHQGSTPSPMPPQQAVPVPSIDQTARGFYSVMGGYHNQVSMIPYESQFQYFPTLLNAHHVAQNPILDPWMTPVPFQQMRSAQTLIPTYLNKEFVSTYSGDSSTSSPVAQTSYSGGYRSAIVSPSETSSISSETVPVKLYKCCDCDCEFPNKKQLYAHLQNTRHCKASLQTYHKSCEVKNSVGDLSETDSWTSSTSIYFCAVCNIVVNSQTQLDSHNAGQKHKQRLAAQKKQSRSSEPTERIMDSGYVSSSGDEVICVAHPTPDRPTAKFRCQLCDTLLNSPAQAKQHLRSQKHILNLNASRTVNKTTTVRRKSNSISAKKASAALVYQLDSGDLNSYKPDEFHQMTRSQSSLEPDAGESFVCGAHSF